jgi:hypothetical protein
LLPGIGKNEKLSRTIDPNAGADSRRLWQERIESRAHFKEDPQGQDSAGDGNEGK